MQLSFSDIQLAWACKDPALVSYMVKVAQQTDLAPEQPVPDDELTFDRFLQKIYRADFRSQPADSQFSYRLEQIQKLEADTGSYPLPERLKLHLLLVLLWEDDSAYARHVLIDAIRRLPLVYGPWKAFKHIYKAAEQRGDYPMCAEIAVRIDCERYVSTTYGMSLATKTYMTLRGWRYLRKLGEALPACYPEAAIHYLAAYPDGTNWDQCWIANHIFYHNRERAYGRHHFNHMRIQPLKHRAFADSWLRQPEPLLRLLALARAEKIRQYACDALKTDFKTQLRDVTPQAIQQLAAIPVQSAARDGLIVWLLNNSPKFEQHQFANQGLHQLVLDLLESTAQDAQTYACEYAKAHARNLPVATLLRLAENGFAPVRQLAMQFIGERDPRQGIGLAAWGILLDSSYHHAVAATVLHKHFSRSELSADWFSERLLTGSRHSIAFCQKYLPELHPLKTLGVAYFEKILLALEDDNQLQAVANFALQSVQQLGAGQLSADVVQTLLLHPLTQNTLQRWLKADEIKPSSLAISYCQALAYEPDWHANSWLQALQHNGKLWARQLAFDEGMAEQMREWLADVRLFAPASMGFDWLMTLAGRDEARYHDFAVERITKAFVPADFAPVTTDAAASPAAAPATATVDLQQHTFLFTGKLSTMTREEAEAKVTNANGKNAGSVTAKLDYLVIGDDGSPLYGNGRKGSKQVKAESLIASGAAIKIISETAFLQMLAGTRTEASGDRVMAGCEVLWQMATDKPDSAASRLALRYMRHHHPQICLQLTDRPVDPDAELPPDFLSFSRLQPLFQHPLSALRQFALDIAHWELKRWSPSSAELVQLCESRHQDVREFMHKALLDESSADNKHYRLDAAQLEAQAVYGLCESRHGHARQLGMQIIQHHTAFQQPDALFQLTESPDREIRYAVVRLLWTLYRRYETTRNWLPKARLVPSLGKVQQDKIIAYNEARGTGLPKRPAQWPASPAELQALLQRWLYELPPARLGRDKSGTSQKPLPASQAKRALIDTLRDLALADADFAGLVLPLLHNFTYSRGKMEQAACLVAVTRIHHAHPQLGSVQP